MRESKIESALKEYVMSQGGECLKFTSPGTKGVSARICIAPTEEPQTVFYKLVWVEVKQKNKKPKRHQRKFHRVLEKLNQTSYVLDRIEDIESLFKGETT